MGCDFYASYAIGVKFNKKDLVIERENPLYGKFKFDPDTGVKVSKFIRDEMLLTYIDRFLEEDYTNYCSMHDDLGITFYGKITSVDIDNSNYKKIEDNHIDSLPKDYSTFIKILSENKIPYEEGCFLIGRVSC